MTDKISFKELSTWNKLGVIGGWVALGLYVFWMIVGFVVGVIQDAGI